MHRFLKLSINAVNVLMIPGITPHIMQMQVAKPSPTALIGRRQAQKPIGNDVVLITSFGLIVIARLTDAHALIGKANTDTMRLTVEAATVIPPFFRGLQK